MAKRFLHTVGMDEEGDEMTYAEVNDHIIGVSVDLNPTLYGRQLDPHAIMRQLDGLRVGESFELARFSSFKRIR